jgi:hypothetical protein
MRKVWRRVTPTVGHTRGTPATSVKGVVASLVRGRFRFFIGGLAATIVTLVALTPASASSANISHSFSAGANIPNGSLVSLDPAHSNFVEPANSQNGSQLLGVAVASNDSLLAIDPGSGQVQVATSGTANALVSTLNGPVIVGDQISVSPFNGIGMKATLGSHVIGLAQTAFNANTSGSTTQQITDKRGRSSQIFIGYVRLNIAIGTANTQAANSEVSGLQKFAQNLTGHTVSTARIVVSLVIALVAFLALVTLIYASIYGGIISIGRNPLAKYAISRSVASVLGMVILVAIVASTTIFFLLR